MKNFTYTSHAQRVVFGSGSLQQIRTETEALGAHKALIVCTDTQRDQAETVAGLLGARAGGIFDGARMHVPVDVVSRALKEVRRVGADCVVAIGGGSTIGLGKALALEVSLPILAIPTTYAGSEMTPIYGLTENGVKRTGRDPLVLPRTVIYDVDLTMNLPAALSVTSGLNAIAHAAEGLYAQDANPVMALMAKEGIRAVASGIARVHANSSDSAGRAECLYGAWLCGTVLGNVGMALHHKLCHTLGGSFDLPHAETHTVILPHAMAYNETAAPEAMLAIREALAVHDTSVAAALYDLAQRLDAPVALRDLGMSPADIDRAADISLANPYWNPRPIEQVAIRKLLQDAYDGRRPD